MQALFKKISHSINTVLHVKEIINFPQKFDSWKCNHNTGASSNKHEYFVGFKKLGLMIKSVHKLLSKHGDFPLVFICMSKNVCIIASRIFQYNFILKIILHLED